MPAVPFFWKANSVVKTIREIGTTRCARSGLITERPSAALRTDMAGVIMASPRNNDAPTIAIVVTTNASRPTFLVFLVIRAASASIPPSPWLLALRIRPT